MTPNAGSARWVFRGQNDVVPLVDVLCAADVSDDELRRVAQLLPDLVAEAVDCPEEPWAGPAGVVSPERDDPLGRRRELLSGDTASPQLLVDARGGALMIAELAASVRRHRLGWGRIVSLTSGGSMGFPGEVSYGAAKAALDNYTMSASIELASDGVTANVVYPPVTDTGWITDEVRAFVDASPDHVHIADPTDVAEVISWLCTDAARLVTGNVLHLR